MTMDRLISIIPQFVFAAISALSLTQCANLPLTSAPEPEVVYALGSNQGYPSPADSKLKPAIPALSFLGDSYNVSGRHRVALQTFAKRCIEDKQRYLIVGYSSPDLPKDHARALSERRAQAVRQQLILLGVEPANLLTCGVGSDFAPNGPTTGVVVIYTSSTAEQAATQPATPNASAVTAQPAL